jgi:hypothetical protein
MSESDLQNTLKYKFIKALTKNQHSKNPLTRNISSSLMNSMVSLHQNFGDKTRENELTLQNENNQQIKKQIKDLIKNAINKYKDQCSVELSDSDKLEMITVLMNHILNTVNKEDRMDASHLKDYLKYITHIVNLACEVTSEESNLLTKEYSKYMSKTQGDERREFLSNLFKDIKNKHKPKSRKSINIDNLINSRRNSRIDRTVGVRTDSLNRRNSTVGVNTDSLNTHNRSSKIGIRVDDLIDSIRNSHLSTKSTIRDSSVDPESDYLNSYYSDDS